MLPIFSMFILMISNGFLLGFIPIRAGIEDFSPGVSGYLASAYFAGILIGAMQINKVIAGVGHIRAFAFFASLISILTLAQGLWVNEWAWMVLRFLYGLSIAGIFITIESWLLVQSSFKMRGVALSIYMTVYYAALSIGELLLGYLNLKSILPFCFAVMLTSFSVLSISITKTKEPIVKEHSFMSLKKLLKISPISLIGALVGGLVLGPAYGLLPVYLQNFQYTLIEISWIMSGMIFGGLLFQWPIGFLSDKFGRRKIFLGAAAFAGALSFFIALKSGMEFYFFLVTMIFFGGACFVFYPLSISYACDEVQPQDIVSTTGAVLLAYGIGSVLGPIISSYGMRLMGDNALFGFFSLISLGLAVLFLFRIFLSKKVPVEEKVPYTNVP